MAKCYAIQYYTEPDQGRPRRAFQVFSAEGKYLGAVLARSDRDDVMDTLDAHYPGTICLTKICVSVKTYLEHVVRMLDE